MSFSCQLSTLFSCNCVNCLGGFTSPIASTNTNTTTTYTTQDSIEDLYQLHFTTTISGAISVVSHPNEISSNHNQEEEEERAKFSSTSSSVDEQENEENKKQQQIQQVEETHEQEQEQQPEAPKKLTRRQRRQQHTRSFLDVARSLRDSPKLFRNKPAHVVPSANFHSEEAQKYFLERCNERFKEERRRFKRLRRRQYLPSWCYEKNDNTLRSLRELVCVFVGGDEEYKIIDKRATNATWRLPRSTALAHKFKNRWIVRNRIFNCKAPFSNVFNWSDDASYNKPDSRGLRARENDEKFFSKDGRERYNRNGGRHRRAHRNNNYHQGRQVYMGNSRKTIFGKPWLYRRQVLIFKGKSRVVHSDF
jgi:hypothetical protein